MSSSACSCSSLVCAPWQKTWPNRKWRPFTSFCFRFQKSFVLFQSVCLCLSRGKEVAARNPAIAHCKTAWEFGGIAASPLAAMPSCPPIAGDIPGCRSPRRAVHGRSRHRPATDSMPAGSPLTQARGSPLTKPAGSPLDSSPPDWRWLMPAGRRYP